MNARNRVMRTLLGEQEAPAFIPLAEALAPRLAGCTYSEMTANATAWVSGVQQAAKLLAADAVCIGFDSRLAVDACLANANEPETAAPMSILLDAAERLFAVQRSSLGCVVALTGPATMAAELTSGLAERDAMAAVKAPATRLVEAASRLRPDLIVFMEAKGALSGAPSPELRRLYATLRKVTAHYGVATGIQADGGQGLEALGCEVLFCDATRPLTADAWRAVVAALPPKPAEAEATARRLLADRSPGSPAIAFGLQDITGTANLEDLRTIRTTIATLVA